MTGEKCGISADFLEHPARPLFHLFLEPASGDARGAVLFFAPFADEMHMSRHIVAAAARELAGAGYAVMLPDLYGCGDAPGDFSQATWSIWLEDMQHALVTLQQRCAGPVVLWGLRAGCLLAAQLAAGSADVARLVLWQPVLNGEQQIDQFLRLESAATALNSGEAFDRQRLWSALREGQTLEIGGYSLSPDLALEMSRLRLANLVPHCAVDWVDIAASGQATSAARHVLDGWSGAGVELTHTVVKGGPFWRTMEARRNPQLEAALVSCLETLQ